MIPDAVGHNGYSSSASYWYGAGHAPMATLLATSEYCLQAHVSKFERMSIGSVALQVDHVRVNLTGNNPREVSRASGQGRDSGLSKRSRSGDRLSGPGALQAASTSTRRSFRHLLVGLLAARSHNTTRAQRQGLRPGGLTAQGDERSAPTRQTRVSYGCEGCVICAIVSYSPMEVTTPKPIV